MVTPLGLLIAIIVACVVCSALMIALMLADAPRPAWYRRFNVGAIALGLSLVLFGVFQFSIARRTETTGRPSYNRRAPVTAGQSYAAAAGFVAAGVAVAVVAVRQRKRCLDETTVPPTI